MNQPDVYILASQRNRTLYMGVTGDLIQCIQEHKNNLVEGVTQRRSVHRLVNLDQHQDMLAAMARE